MAVIETEFAEEHLSDLSAPQSWQPSLSPAAPEAPPAPIAPPSTEPPDTTPSTPFPSTLPAAPNPQEDDGDEGPCPGPCRY